MPKSQTASEQIRDLEVQRHAAMRSGDVAVLAKLLSDDLVYAHSTGDRDTKSSYLAKLQDKVLDYLDLAIAGQQIRIIDNVALVTGIMKAKVLVAGSEKRLENGTLAVWIERNGQWQLVAFQPTALTSVNAADSKG